MGVNPIEKEIAELFMNFYESFDVMSWLKNWFYKFSLWLVYRDGQEW